MKKRGFNLLLLCLFTFYIMLLSSCQNNQKPVPSLDKPENGILASNLSDIKPFTIYNESPEVLSDSLSDLQFELNHVVYQLPVSLSQILDNGWNNEGMGLSKRLLAPEETTYFEPFFLNEDIIYLTLVNPFNQNLLLKKCPVTAIRFPFYENQIKTSLVFPGGITRRSSYNDVLTAYGEPDKVIPIEENQALYYILDEEIFAEIIIRINENDEVCELEMAALRVKGDLNQKYAEPTIPEETES